MNIDCKITDSLATIKASQWQKLSGQDNPFLQYPYLAGLEKHHCLDGHGWYPCHVIAESDGILAGALIMYLKTNSTGEFVFDWSWADAYERAGGRYYPKLVSAIPFTPVAGSRFLVRPDIADRNAIIRALYRKVRQYALDKDLSGIHFLFPDKPDRLFLQEQGLLLREGCQYYWFNDHYSSFDDFLSRLTARRRKEIRRERKAVHDAGITIEVLHGEMITPEHWEVFNRFYRSTFYRKWGEPRLTLDFFQSLVRDMPASPLLVMASHNGHYVAGAFAMQGKDTLFGRHWGCNEHFRFLHFELCYYQTIEYCIRHGLGTLDAGVQGEHKLSRGFLPVRTWSAHWIANDAFRDAIARFLDYEHNAIEDYISDLQHHLAYKAA